MECTNISEEESLINELYLKIIINKLNCKKLSKNRQLYQFQIQYNNNYIRENGYYLVKNRKHIFEPTFLNERNITFFNENFVKLYSLVSK